MTRRTWRHHVTRMSSSMTSTTSLRTFSSVTQPRPSTTDCRPLRSPLDRWDDWTGETVADFRGPQGAMPDSRRLANRPSGLLYSPLMELSMQPCLSLLCPPLVGTIGIKRWCASDICLTSVCLSQTSVLSREQRGLEKLKLSQMYPTSHVTRTLLSKSKGQRSTCCWCLKYPICRNRCHLANKCEYIVNL